MTEILPTRQPEDLIVVQRHVETDDIFENEKRDPIEAVLGELSQMGTEYYANQGLDVNRKRKGSPDMDNPATQELCRILPSFKSWLDTMPTAAALHPLYNPRDTHLPNGTELDENIGDWFKNIADARGMRSRAEILKNLLESNAKQSEQPQEWLSLACGAALPVFSAMHKLAADQATIPRVTLADADKEALGLADTYAEDHGFDQSTKTVRTNVLNPNGLSYPKREGFAGYALSSLAKRVSRKMPAESYDVVDAVGILEYLGEDDWEYTYNKVITSKRPFAGAKTFLQNAYELVKPGGLLVVGNMLDTHPQLEFTLNVIQWPHIQPRSVDRMVDIFKGAGIKGEVEVLKPDDGVYAMYSIRKPE